MNFLIKAKEKMIMKKYQQLLLHSQFGGITIIDDTQMLAFIRKKPRIKWHYTK